MSAYTEDTLVQQTTADYLRDDLGWRSVLAYNHETFGAGGLLGRENDKEVILKPLLREKLEELNPDLPELAYQDAVRQVVESMISQTLFSTNREKYELLRNGVRVAFRNDQGEQKKQTLRVFDFDEPTENDFLCVRELWVRGDLYRRRADIIGFVNGIPLLFVECKNVHRDLEVAFRENLADYKDTIPHLFHHNAIVMLGNGIEAKVGTITSQYNHFADWKRLEEDEPGVVDMETLLKGICDKRNFMDLIENFILFDDSTGKAVKILARNHQFLGVNRAIESVEQREEREGKLGVFWHTQGSGKSYSMLFFTRKVHRRLGGNFTFVILTDRDDLDGQIYKTFAGCGVVNNDRDPCRAANGKHLERLLGQHKSYVFSLIQKFNQDVEEDAFYSERDDVIVITDEAHRTQYGTLALNLRNALPNASYMGFTGTPLFSDDEITRRVFGEYVSTYDFQRAVEDGATVPLYYDARGERLKIATNDLNERIAEKLEEIESTMDINKKQRLEQALKQDYHIITAHERLSQVAEDFVEHYSTGWESGKAMLVCIDKITCVKMHELISKRWKERIEELSALLPTAKDEQDELYRLRQLAWMQETEMAVVVSEEQGEMEKFRKWDLDITPHRRLIKEGFSIPEKLRDRPEFMGMQHLDMDSAFKEPAHPFRVVIVCAMWLTGFDVPSLSTLYIDKPLKAHTLMQAIARANRVSEGKNNGLIVDYCGILKNLRKALATFAGAGDDGRGGGGGGADPGRPKEELLEELGEAIGFVRSFLDERNAPLDDIKTATGFGRNAAIVRAKEAANENDESRKRFEIMCRAVFKKFKACINDPGVNAYRPDRDAINVVYKHLQKDKESADISDIIRILHGVVDEVVETKPSGFGNGKADYEPYDISKIDFERLRQEFERSPAKKTTVQCMSDMIEQRLKKMLERNPLRTDMQAHYEKIIAEYNSEKSRLTIEQTFAELLKKVQELDEEEDRAVREGLNEESLAIFDLLKKPELGAAEIKRIKAVAEELLETLKAEVLKIHHWQEKESTRDAVSITIHNFLYDGEHGLPENSYTETDVSDLTSAVYRHIYRAYPEVPSPVYGEVG
ncbi:Type-1 restriction enzyme R protein [Pontiella desulfatans]|uniref:Type I restriction enzyme endonuclease subunit n=1 Tax=Pontiella desulfatans TaxID=2750659 RepID=A0A6C2UC79_PONDE|nr:type I restriction endonuclease subunit R [Pontiella desulfatans]VGO17197.1 Type-1 restriction enzyme R protein [Pontiella desulfatans]